MAVFLYLAVAGSAADFSAWGQRLQVAFEGYAPPGGAVPLTNFPALVVLSTNIPGFQYGDFKSPPYGDLRFTASDQATELNYEVELWDTNGASLVWVQVPVLEDSASHLWAYWGKGGETPPACTTNGAVWSDGFAAVWHMNQTAPRDSTSNTNHGSAVGSVTLAGGRIGSAVSLDGASYVNVPDSSSLSTFPTGMTVSLWLKTGSVYGVPISHWNSNVSDGYGWYAYGGVYDGWFEGNAWAASHVASGRQTDNAWHLYAFIGSGTASATYRDAATAVGYGGFLPTTISAPRLAMGVDNRYLDAYLTGALDEVRVETVARSTAWLWACYMNQASNGVFAGSFNTYGSVQVAGSGLPRIENVAAQNGTDSAIELVGRLVTNGSSAAGIRLYWSTSDGFTNSADWTLSGFASNLGFQADGAVFTNTLAGLAPGTVYYWNHSASNEAGTVWGADAGSPSFVTLELPAVTLGQGVRAVLETEALLEGNLLSGTAARVYLLLGTTDGEWAMTNDFGTLNEGPFSTNVTGLLAGTTYYYTCLASNAAGVSMATPSAGFITVSNITGTCYVDGQYDGANGLPDGSAARPYRAIASGARAAGGSDGNTVLIADGVYRSVAAGGGELMGTGIRVNRNVAFRGGYAGQLSGAAMDWTEEIRQPRGTILDLTGTAARAFMTESGAMDPVWDGLTIRNASVSGNGGAILMGGAFNTAGAIRNCLFVSNTVSGSGGAVFAYNNSRSDLRIENCDFIANQASGGGALALNGETPGRLLTVTGSTFTANRSAGSGGGAVLWGFGSPVISASMFASNAATSGSGAGVYAGAANVFCRLAIQRCVFAGNTASSGPALGGSGSLPGEVVLENALIIGNTATASGAFILHLNSADGVRATLRHVTLATNAAPANGGAIGIQQWMNDADLYVTNCLIVGRGTGTGILTDDPTPELDYNNVYDFAALYGGTAAAGAHDLAIEPKFADAAGGDYRLAARSRCRNAGIEAGVGVDLAGNSRPFDAQDGGYDLGCYEMPPPPGGTLILFR